MHLTRRFTLVAAATAIAAVVLATVAAAAGPDTRPATRPVTSAKAASQPASRTVILDAAHRVKAKELMDKGAKYLLGKRSDKGAWSAAKGAAVPAITAMVLKALVQHPDYGPNHPAVVKGFEVLLSYKQPDGGIYSAGEVGASYSSAVALMALAAEGNPKHAQEVRELTAYLKGLQIVAGAESSDNATTKKTEDPNVGGVSYDKGPGRPDLSNVGMWMSALHEAGVPADDPAMQRAVAFVTRLQNSSETNSMAWAKEGDNDGGFIYTFPGGRGPGASQAPRSYGSMTYTGFKSMLYAGVDRDDPRVKGALEWIRRYWRLDSNPNMPQAQSKAGLYYYYHVFAKALNAWGEPTIKDAAGVEHNWRHELIDALASQVQDDGSWVNNSDRWWEGEPVLATSYAMLALEEALLAK